MLVKTAKPPKSATKFCVCQIRNGEQKVYLLKNKELTAPTKGVIHLEVDVIYNTVSVVCVCAGVELRCTVWPDLGHMTCSAPQVKAALRTVVPAEQKYIEEEPKVSKQVCVGLDCHQRERDFLPSA